MATVRMQLVYQPGATLRFDAKTLQPSCTAIVALWHEGLIFPTAAFGKVHAVTLVSQSRDGDMIAQIAGRLGWQVARGSSTRGGVRALREVLAKIKTREQNDNQGGQGGDAGLSVVAVTADGPRGPRRVCKPGPVWLARQTGFDLVPLGVACTRARRAKSWDRLILPWPGSSVVLVVGPSIASGSENALADLQQAMQHATLEAERIANTPH